MREHEENSAACWCDPMVIPAGYKGWQNGVEYDGSTVVDIISHNAIEEV